MGMCKALKGVLVLLAGLEMYLNIPIAGMTGVQVAGLLFALFGLTILLHVAGVCNSCKNCCK